MGFWLLSLVTCAYAWIAVESALKRDWPVAIMFGGYFIANFGPLWLLWKR
jgi:hypothetical protein